ncbi:MAG: nitronate monooxygenase, partial [bacterium]
SCPNVKHGGIAFGTDAGELKNLLKSVKKTVRNKIIIVKLSPNVADIGLFAKIAEDNGADAISLINTITAMAIDVRTRRPKIARITGGLSGPAIKPIAVRMVWEAHQAVGIPVIGMGGIMDHEDAIEFMLAGASAVAVGTANFIDPQSTVRIIDGIKDYLAQEKIQDVKDLIGGVRI